MLSKPTQFVKVANLDELTEGKPRAVKVEGHPARNQLLVGLSQWTTDVRKRTEPRSVLHAVKQQWTCTNRNWPTL